MEDVLLLEDHQDRSNMEMEDRSATFKFNEAMAPTDLNRYGQSHMENVHEQNHREDKISQVQEPALLSPQKKLHREENDSRSVEIEQVHRANKVQDADTQTNQTITPTRGMDGIVGPQRWLLPSVSQQNIQTVPRILLPRPELAIQGNAVRAEHSPKDLHENNRIHSPMLSKGGHMVPPLFGRPANYSYVAGRMSPEASQSTGDPQRTRMDCKHGEVQNGTQTSIRMAGSQLQPHQLYSNEYRTEPQSILDAAEGDSEQRYSYKTQHHATTGARELVGPSQPTSSFVSNQNKTASEKPQISPFRCQNTSESPHEMPHGQMVPINKSAPETGPPRAHINNSLGCLADRMGIQNQPEMVSRRLRPDNEEILYQCFGTPNNLVGHTYDSEEESSNKDYDRQLHSRVSNQESYIKYPHTSGTDRADLETSSFHELDSVHSSHTREVQHSSRPTVEEHDNFYRMDYSPNHLPQGNPKTRAQTTSGPICHKSQSQTEDLRVTMSGSESCRSRRTIGKLEQMESSVHVPSNTNDFEGFSKVDTVKYKKWNRDFKGRTLKTLVSTIEVQAHPITTDTSEIATTSRRQNDDRTQSFQTSHMEVLKIGISNHYPNYDEETINLISNSIKQSSESDYQGKWKQFLKFIAEKDISFDQVTIDAVLRFFTYLFYKRGLKPSTISHYRSALAQPLLAYFNINLNVPAVHSMLRAMRLQRPPEPHTRPAWSLNLVLEYLNNLDTSSVTNALRKSAFLLLLATGWRISEVHACVRDDDFCRFTENSLIIQPHSSFLAKNGLRKRLEAKEIKTLLNEDGNVSNICPVSSLSDYLYHTRNKKKGCLFIDPKDDKNLTLFKLRLQVCSIITEADPETRKRVHDIRTYAASCTLQQDMIVGDLIEDFNWSSAAVFYKHYFVQTETLNRPVALPGRS